MDEIDEFHNFLNNIENEEECEKICLILINDIEIYYDALAYTEDFLVDEISPFLQDYADQEFQKLQKNNLRLSIYGTSFTR